jgi:hypothetical protein
MLGWSSSLFGLHSSDPLKDTFMLIKESQDSIENQDVQK